MSATGLLQIALYVVIVLLLAKPIGAYMARVFTGERTFLSPVLGPVETAVYRVSGVDPSAEQRWTAYTAGMLLFSVVGLLVLYALQRLQGFLPFNPQGFGPVAPDLAFNTAVSFTTNTNWQAYSGESTMSYLTQMAGPRVPQLRLGRHGHRDRHRADSRPLATIRRGDRELLGRPRAGDPLRAACPSA